MVVRLYLCGGFYTETLLLSYKTITVVVIENYYCCLLIT